MPACRQEKPKSLTFFQTQLNCWADFKPHFIYQCGIGAEYCFQENIKTDVINTSVI